MPQVIVVRDKIGWMEWDERLRRYVKHYHLRGETAEIPDAELERYKALAANSTDPLERGRPHVLPADEYEAWTDEQVRLSNPVYELTDDQIMALSADELLGRINQVPGLAERVLPLEQSRPKPRKGILEHCQRLIDAQDGKDVSLSEGEAQQPLTPSEA